MKGSRMITFNKAGMKEALGEITHWYSDWHSPHFYLREDFPVRFWHETGGLSFDGKDWGIISLDNNELWISKGVRLR